MALYHPYQSIYFNGFLSKENKNNYEGDYYGLSTSKAILEILKKDKEAQKEISKTMEKATRVTA